MLTRGITFITLKSILTGIGGRGITLQYFFLIFSASESLAFMSPIFSHLLITVSNIEVKKTFYAHVFDCVDLYHQATSS